MIPPRMEGTHPPSPEANATRTNLEEKINLENGVKGGGNWFYFIAAAKGKPDRVFTLVEGAKLTLDGEKAQLAAIKPDMYIGGRAKRISDTKVEAHTINVKSKALERKKPAKKKEA